MYKKRKIPHWYLSLFSSISLSQKQFIHASKLRRGLLAKKNDKLVQKDAQLLQKDEQLQEKDEKIAELEALIAELQKK